MDVLHRYAEALAAVGSKLVIVSADERLHDQLIVAGLTEVIGRENIYDRDERVGRSVTLAHARPGQPDRGHHSRNVGSG